MAGRGQVKRGRIAHCEAVHYDGMYTRGYSCEHAPDHDGPHRDKHGREWEDEVSCV